MVGTNGFNGACLGTNGSNAKPTQFQNALLKPTISIYIRYSCIFCKNGETIMNIEISIPKDGQKTCTMQSGLKQA